MSKSPISIITTICYTLLPFLLGLSTGCKSQRVKNSEMGKQQYQIFEIQDESLIDGEEEDPVFVVVEEMPEFPGGVDNLRSFVQENLNYPEKARQEKIQGTVFISFVIEKDGTVSTIKVLRGVYEELDAEAIRVIQSMPVWKPGKQRGKPVRVRFNHPISFRL